VPPIIITAISRIIISAQYLFLVMKSLLPLALPSIAE